MNLKMKRFRYLIILLCLLLFSPVQAEEERTKWGEVWNSWTELQKYLYLWGYKDGMVKSESLHNAIVLPLVSQKCPREVLSKYLEAAPPIRDLFPDLDVLKDVMTEFYKDPANTYLEFDTILWVSHLKLNGESAESIERVLARERKRSYQLHMYLKTKDRKYLETDQE
ncbi:MAG: hypothetical protein GTO24_03730 [candidate division Zixibacteria bacterium]|nr:hypothetical protein [candidate division Zixibacteria bacterium]